MSCATVAKVQVEPDQLTDDGKRGVRCDIQRCGHGDSERGGHGGSEHDGHGDSKRGGVPCTVLAPTLDEEGLQP